MPLFRKERPGRRVVVYTADWHCGHKLALMPPDIELFEEDPEGNLCPYTPAMTGVQKYLWQCFEEDLDGVAEFADGDPIVVIMAGDVAHGLKYPQHLVSTRAADQVIIAGGCLERVLRVPNVIAVRLVTGTAAHSLGEGTAAIFTARELGVKHPRLDVAIVHHGLFSVAGVLQDVAHHGPGTGIRTWLKGNVLYLYALSILMEHLEAGKEPPRAIIRGHKHEYVHRIVTKMVRGVEYVVDAFILPSYSGLSSFALQSGQSPYLLGNGLLALRCEGERLLEHKAFVRVKDTRRVEEL